MSGGARFTLEWADFPIEPVDGLVSDPVWDDVLAIVGHLGAAPAQGGFIVLRRSDAEFIQAAKVPEGLLVEYRDPRSNDQFTLAEGPTDTDTAISLFKAWFDDPADIDEHADWEILS